MPGSPCFSLFRRSCDPLKRFRFLHVGPTLSNDFYRRHDHHCALVGVQAASPCHANPTLSHAPILVFPASKDHLLTQRKHPLPRIGCSLFTLCIELACRGTRGNGSPRAHAGPPGRCRDVEFKRKSSHRHARVGERPFIQWRESWAPTAIGGGRC